MGMELRLKTLSNERNVSEFLIKKAQRLWINHLVSQFSKLDATRQGKKLVEALNEEDTLVRNEDLYLNLEWNKAAQQFQQFAREAFANTNEAEDLPTVDDLINVLEKIDVNSQQKCAIALASIMSEQEYNLIQDRLLKKIIKNLDKSSNTSLGEFLRGSEIFLALFRERYRGDGQVATFNSIISYVIREVRRKVEKSNEEVNDKLEKLPLETRTGVELAFNALWFGIVCQKELKVLKAKRNHDYDEIMTSQKNELNGLYQQQKDAISKLNPTDTTGIQKCKAEWDTKIQHLITSHKTEFDKFNETSLGEINTWMSENAIFKGNLPGFDEIPFPELPTVIKEMCQHIYKELEKELPSQTDNNNNLLTREKILSFVGGVVFLRFIADLLKRYPHFASADLKDSDPKLFSKLNNQIRDVCINTFQMVLVRCSNDIGFPPSTKEKTENWKKFFEDEVTPLVRAQKNPTTQKERLVEFLEDCACLAENNLVEIPLQVLTTPICQTTENLQNLKKQEASLKKDIAQFMQLAEGFLEEACVKHLDQSSPDKERKLFAFIAARDEENLVEELQLLEKQRKKNYTGIAYEVVFSTKQNGQDLITVAIEKGISFETLRVLAADNAGWHQYADNYIWTAVAAQNLQAIRWIRAFSLATDNVRDEVTPLLFAVQQYIQSVPETHNWLKVISYLMAREENEVKAFECQIDLNRKFGSEQSTIVHSILQNVTKDNWKQIKPLMQLLLRNGVPVDLYSESRFTALNQFLHHCLITKKKTDVDQETIKDVAKLLVEHGANVSLSNEIDGLTPYLILQRNGFDSLANELFKICTDKIKKAEEQKQQALKKSSSDENKTSNANDNNNTATVKAEPSVVATKQSIFVGSRDRRPSEADTTKAPEKQSKKEEKHGLLGTLKSSVKKSGSSIWKSGTPKEDDTSKKSSSLTPGMTKQQ